MSYISLVFGLKYHARSILWKFVMFNNSHVVVTDETRRARLRWRAKRGLLENDIVMTRFFNAYETQLTDDDVHGLDMLLDLPDDELFALIMSRKELVEIDPAEHLMDEAGIKKAEHVLNILRSV
jgi:antitoxin CptB